MRSNRSPPEASCGRSESNAARSARCKGLTATNEPLRKGWAPHGAMERPRFGSSSDTSITMYSFLVASKISYNLIILGCSTRERHRPRYGRLHVEAKAESGLLHARLHAAAKAERGFVQGRRFGGRHST